MLSDSANCYRGIAPVCPGLRRQARAYARAAETLTPIAAELQAPA
jgi:hypothetical protein